MYQTGAPLTPCHHRTIRWFQIRPVQARFVYIDLYGDQDERRASDLVGEIERFSLVTTGKLSVDWWANEEVYFEAFYLNSQVFSKATTEQIFPLVPGQIAQEDANGNIIVDATGAPILVDNPLNPFPTGFFRLR